MLDKLRGKFAQIVLRKEYRELDTLRKSYIKATKTAQDIEPARAFRSQMKGFEPTDIDSTDDIEVLYDTEELGLDGFLADIKTVSDSIALKELIKVLKRNQIMHTALETNNIEQVNFGRATVNGLMLLEDEIDRLVGIHNERNETEDNYDTNEVV